MPKSASVASLGWVTPGAATDGVTPLFFPWKHGDLFCSSLSPSLSLFIAFTRVSPPPWCHPTPFLPVRPRFSTIPCKFAHTNFFPSGVTPWRVTPEAEVVTPLERMIVHVGPTFIRRVKTSERDGQTDPPWLSQRLHYEQRGRAVKNLT